MTGSDEVTGNGQNEDPVGEALRGLFKALGDSPTGSWSSGQCAAVLEALEDAVRPHRHYTDPDDAEGEPGWCALDGNAWPCPTYRQVQDTLEGLL